MNFLLEGKIDLAVGNFCRSGRHDAIAYEVLGTEELCIVARSDHAIESQSRSALASRLLLDSAAQSGTGATSYREE